MSRELSFDDKLLRNGLHIKTRGEVRRVEQKRASAARSLEAAITLGAALYKSTGSDDDAQRLALVVAAHEHVTGSKVASVKILADPDTGAAAHLSAVAHKSLAFLGG